MNGQISHASDEQHNVAGLLTRAGVDTRTPLGAELLAVATEGARDWADRAAQAETPLSPLSAAALGLRSLAADMLTWADGVAERETEAAIAHACLQACDLAERQASAGPQRRRWGEGSTPRMAQRPAPAYAALRAV